VGSGGGEALVSVALDVQIAVLGLAALAVAGAAGPSLRAQQRDTVPDKLAVTEPVYQGWKYYQVYCARCHGENATGGFTAPDLLFAITAEGGVTPDSFRVVVHRGTESKEMKGFDPLLDDELIDRIYAYVRERSAGRLAPGRPHRAPPPR